MEPKLSQHIEHLQNDDLSGSQTSKLTPAQEATCRNTDPDTDAPCNETPKTATPQPDRARDGRRHPTYLT